MQVLFGAEQAFTELLGARAGVFSHLPDRVFRFRSALQHLEFFAVEGDDFRRVVGEEDVVRHP